MRFAIDLRNAIRLLAFASVFAWLYPDEAGAAEVKGIPRVPADWSEIDRRQFCVSSRALVGSSSETSLDPKNSFVRAASHNTRVGAHTEYKSIEERHCYYEWLSRELEQSSSGKRGISEVKFFHAAAAVTHSWTGVGILEFPMSASVRELALSGLGAAAAAFLARTNARLFEVNFSFARSLLFEWTELRDPRSREVVRPVGSLDFDLAMVEIEQLAVQRMLDEEPAVAASGSTIDVAVRASLLLNGSTNDLWRLIAAAGVEAPLRSFKFASFGHRQALGASYMHLLRKGSPEQLREYLRRQIPRGALEQ